MQEKDRDINKKKQTMSVNIRLNNREEIFNKRRMFTFNDIMEDNEDMNEENSQLKKQDPKLYVIDNRFKEHIEKFSTNNYDFSSLQTLNTFFKEVIEGDIIQQHEGMIGIRRTLTSQAKPPVKEVFQSDVSVKVFQYLQQSQYPQLKMQAGWILTNLAAGSPQQCQAIVQRGGENQPGIVEQAIWAAGNIAADRIQYRNKLIKQGGVEALVNVIGSAHKNIIIQNGCWALSNLCRGKPEPHIQKIATAFTAIAPAVGAQLIKDKDILSDCLWVLGKGTQKTPLLLNYLIKIKGIVPFLFRCLRNPYLGILMPSLTTIGNMSCGDEIHTQCLLQNGFLPVALELVNHPKESIRRQIAWALSNVAAGTPKQVQFFISQKQIIHELLKKLQQESSHKVKRQLGWIFANFAYEGNPELVINFYLENNILYYYENFMQVANEDHDYKQCLDYIHRMLKIGKKCQVNNENIICRKIMQTSIPKYIEKLLSSTNQELFEKATRLVNKYFVSNSQMS